MTKVKAKFTIGSVTQKLLMIYLAAPQPKILTVNVVCSVIYGSNNVTAANKMKVIDVINILVATGLFRRVTVRENKKRGNNALAFQFVGRLEEDGLGSHKTEERNTSITRVLEIHEW